MNWGQMVPLCTLLGFWGSAAADVAPPPLKPVAAKAQADAESVKLDTCAPSYEETPGPRGTLITHRHIEYDVMLGQPAITPPEARAQLRAFIDRFYKAVRPCLPPGATLHPPERLPLMLHLMLAGARGTSAVALSTDPRVDKKCIEALFGKQQAPALPVATARLSVEMTLAPFCVITHELQRGDELPSPFPTQFGSGRNHHLMPAAGR